MARYRCTVCGYIYDEEKEGKPFSALTECPMCRQPVSKFEKLTEDAPAAAPAAHGTGMDYPAETARRDESIRYMKEIHEMAVTGQSLHAAMGIDEVLSGKQPSWPVVVPREPRA